MSENRRERSDRLKQRFDRDTDEADTETETETATEEIAQQADASKSDERGSISGDADAANRSERSGESIKDRPSVLMYLPEELHTELDIRFDELNAQHKREHGHPLEKNRDYYPAVIKASLEGKAVKEILDI